MADEDGGGNNGGELGEREQAPLRVVPLHPDPWLAPQWLPTGEAVVAEFKRLHGERFVYLDALGEFYQWTGHVWQHDQRRLVNRLMAELCRRIGAAQKKKTVRNKVEGAGFISGCASRMRDEVAIPFDLFDCADVFNMTTAAVSMKTNETRGWSAGPQRREDYCSKMAGVTAAAGPCPLWLEFLHKITAGDTELVDYLQRVAGYCASPFTWEQAFFFCYGTGGNGKGTFLNTIKAVLGDYAAQASLEMFVSTKYEAHPEELAALRGVRCVLTAETGQGHSWNEAKIKTLTGGDSIRARFMRQNSFEYMPTFKIIVVGNSKPVLHNVDHAMRRRLHLIPFMVKISEGELDRGFADKLRPEYPAILAWVLDGFVKWRERGDLDPPETVLGATESYFDNQDLLQQWIDQRCMLTNCSDKTTSTALYSSWKLFCEAAGERPGSQKSFVDRLEAKGFERYRDNAGRGFFGIAPT